ncbi:YuiA family protein [Anoxybacillus kestanbolensis]
MNKTTCQYCSGNGYVHVAVGGSETCHYCEGTGLEKDEVVIKQ